MTRARDVANLIGSGNYSSTTFTATAGQTAFSISHTQGFVQVFMNGLLLDLTTDYTSNGSAITLTSGAAAGDEIEVVAYNTFSVGDALNQAAADTRYVNTTGDTMTGSLTGTSAGFTGDVNIGNNASSNPLSKLRLGGTQYGAADIRPTDEGGHKVGMAFYTDGTGDTTIDPVLRMTIDSSGRVTKPYQTSFYAYTSTDYTADGAMTGGNNWTEKWDTGNNFSAGTFTAPVAGKYFFSVMWDAYAIASTIDIEVNNVGAIRYEPTGRTDATWETHAITGILNLAANDAVRLYGRKHSQSSNNPYHMGGNGQWGHFSGFLIG